MGMISMIQTTPELATARLIEPEQLKQRIQEADDLTMLPAVAMEAIEMSNDPNCEMHDFVNVIEKDPRLVTDLLSLSNSAMYQSSTEIKGIQEAVARIGFRQCQNLIFSSSMKSLMKKLPPAVEWSRDILWQHSIHTSTIARCLNRNLNLRFEGEEFSGAMVHDVGRLLIAAATPDVFEVADRLAFSEGEDTLTNEQALMGTDHCEIGAWFAEDGKIPNSLVDVIRYHHQPSDAPDNNVKLVSLVAAADHMANHLMNMGEFSGYEPENNVGLKALLSLDGGSSSNAIELAENAIRAADEAMKEMAKSDGKSP